MRIYLDTSVFGPHEWKFPESAWEVSERFYTGCELWEAGNTQEAFAVFPDLWPRHPEHLDVRDRLAHVDEEIGQDDRAKALLEEAVALGRRAFPTGFRAGDRLEWGWLENRPFLRCLCSDQVIARARLTRGVDDPPSR